MHPKVLQQLQARSAAIHVRWETLLKMEPVTGPLANPDALVRLIPESLAEVFEQLQERSSERTSLTAVQAVRLPDCSCGHNPYLAYFVAAERAFVETLVLVHAELPAEQRSESDIAETIRAVRKLGGDEIDTFCGICSHRCRDPKCRHTAACAAV